jgi:hypothetical protein
MPDDDLFGPHNPAWERFKTPAPRKRTPARAAPPKPAATVDDEMAQRIRAHWARAAYEQDLEKLAIWKGRMPEADWLKLVVLVESRRPKS